MGTVTWKNSKLNIQPSILVTERLTVQRGVSYHRRDLDQKSYGDGSETVTWETERHFKNKEEAKLADQVYSNARYKIRSKCLYTEVGYICPESEEKALTDAIEEARQMVDEFNDKAKFCHIKFQIVCTRIEPSNNDGIEALRDTLNRNTQQLKEALAEFDFKKARNMLVATKPAVDILKNGDAKKALLQVREEAKEMATEIANLVKEYDGHIENALVSEDGQKLLKRTSAAWNF